MNREVCEHFVEVGQKCEECMKQADAWVVRQVDHLEKALAKRIEAHLALCIEHEELRAEVERLKHEVDKAESNYLVGVFNTALRCAEIAKNIDDSQFNTSNGEVISYAYSCEWLDAAAAIEKLIKKEFNL